MQSPYCSISVVEFKIEQNHIPMPIMRLWFFFHSVKCTEKRNRMEEKNSQRSTVLDRRQIVSQKFTNVKRYFIDFVVENTSRSQDINTVVDFSLPVMTRSGVFWQCVPTVTHGRQSPSRKETRFNGGQNLRAVHDQKKEQHGGMAIVKTFLCFSNTRVGTLICGCYSLVCLGFFFYFISVYILCSKCVSNLYVLSPGFIFYFSFKCVLCIVRTLTRYVKLCSF